MRNVERKSSIYDLKVIIVFAAFFFSHFIKNIRGCSADRSLP